VRWTSIMAIVSSVIVLAMPAIGQSIRKEEVNLKTGGSSTTLKAQITGDQIVDYVLRAKAGQKMTVTLMSGNPSCYFNLTAPGQDAALFVGSTSGSKYEGVLPSDGDYAVRVYLMRNAARRGEKANYSITISVAGGAQDGGAAPQGNAPPAEYDGTGKVKCSADKPTLDGWCDFKVVRHLAEKSADIWLTKPAVGGALQYRVLHFAGRKFTTTDKAEVSSKRDGDNWLVSAGGREFYLIPDALIYGD